MGFGAMNPDVRAIRHKLRLTQQEFADAFGLSVTAIRDWEQGRRRPEMSARVLLAVIAIAPDVVRQAAAMSIRQIPG